MDLILPYLVVIAISGTAMVTGLLFAFSNFVMRALAELPPEYGMLAMQLINKKILNPLFFIFFFGTPLLCVIITICSLSQPTDLHSVFLLLGSVGYLVGPFGITIRYNVPLNDKLDALQASEEPDFWGSYKVDWQRWNHVRTYLGLAAIIFLSLGLGLYPC